LFVLGLCCVIDRSDELGRLGGGYRWDVLGSLWLADDRDELGGLGRFGGGIGLGRGGLGELVSAGLV